MPEPLPAPTAPRPPLAVVLTTVGAGTDAESLARTLILEGLAACVNILPAMISVYCWQGTLERDAEQQLVIKTSIDRVDALEARLRALHPYEIPEFVVVSATASDAYAAWVRRAVTPVTASDS